MTIFLVEAILGLENFMAGGRNDGDLGGVVPSRQVNRFERCYPPG